MYINNKKSIKTVLLVVGLIAILLFSCAEQDNWIPKGMKKASTEAVDYTLFVPDGWTVDISTGVVSAYVSALDRSNITMIAFNLENENSDMTIDEYWEKYEGEMRTTFPDMEMEHESTSAEDGMNPVSMLFDGFNAKKYVYTATVTEVKYKYMQVICIRGGIAYIFTYTSIPENFDTHLEEVDRILETFSFNK
ncbi:MAG: hypothetical protein PHZ09_03390 [Eubacteriales bacterium]|jgi:hypothetical protein|nr:hypothetical protein [Eubacteriales bacterium]